MLSKGGVIGGNITKKTVYPYTTGSLTGVKATSTKTYSYGNSTWKDLLTSYDGKSFTYDTIGNPLSYLGYTLTWNGRQLTKLSGNGVTASYKYDADGLRSYKKVGSVESTYQYLGDKLVYEKRGDIELEYGYNSFGDLAYIRNTTGGTTSVYYVVCNSRGDVENIYGGSGTLLVHYTYDSWGNVISITDKNGKEITDKTNIGIVNPIRYRGYYYDNETGMYYLQSRYYNPQVGRFLNADGYISAGQEILDTNMYAYCGNNPVNRIDSSGDSWENIKNWFFNAFSNVKDLVNSISTKESDSARGTIALAEHHKRGTMNRANRQKHENGQARKKLDNRGEKKDVRRKSWSNKRRSQSIEFAEVETIIICGIVIVGVTIVISYLVANDSTIIGVIDDGLIVPLTRILWEYSGRFAAALM